MKRQRNYKGNCLRCGVPVTIGSKSGHCRLCKKRPIRTQEFKDKARQSKLGSKNPMFGKKPSIETRVKLSTANSGDKSYSWKGGITDINKKIRASLEYKLWRESVYERDNFTCVWCGIRGGKLNADHIKPFAHYPELRFAIDNGRTLCVPCHKTTDTYGFKLKKL